MRLIKRVHSTQNLDSITRNGFVGHPKKLLCTGALRQVDQHAAHTDHPRGMESDTLDPCAIQGDVHLPEDETKFKRKFTQMSITVAGYLTR